MALFGRDSNLNSRVARSDASVGVGISFKAIVAWKGGTLDGLKKRRNLLVRVKNFLQFRKLSYERGKLFELNPKEERQF